MYGSQEIPLRHLGTLISTCWNEAEQFTAGAIAEKYFGPNEETITFIFASEFRELISRRSSGGQISEAFLKDVKDEIPELNYSNESALSGLVARVNFHSRQHEGKISASDLGIVLRRPAVTLNGWRTMIEVNPERATGLLAQAKLGTANSKGKFKWGQLTKSQIKLYPARNIYFSLLLYRLSGEKNNKLNTFGWQLCAGLTLDQVKKHLRAGNFPQEITSDALFKKLFSNEIGTQDPILIKNVIDPNGPSAQTTIDIEIFWPDDKKPPDQIRVDESTHQVQRMTQYR